MFRPALYAMALLAVSLTATSVNAQGRGGQATTDEQLQAGLLVAQLVASEGDVATVVGDSVQLVFRPLDSAGTPVTGSAMRVSGIGITVRNGWVIPRVAGEFEVVATAIVPPGTEQPTTGRVTVSVAWPSIASVEVDQNSVGRLYEETSIHLLARARHADATFRPEPGIRWSSSDASIATVDRFGVVTGHQPGPVNIFADVDGVRGTYSFDVASLAGARIELATFPESFRTGDVVDLGVRVMAGSGSQLDDVPVAYGVSFIPDDSINAPGAAGMVRDGKFLGEVPGVYTVLATAGPASARSTIDVRPREVIRPVEVLGQGSIDYVHTSDLWVFEGTDGRDYAVTGTWGGDGWSYFWDVTDPANIVKYDSIQVDARTINDVKVAPNGRYAALSSEGASNRKNGVTLIDLADPRAPKIAFDYSESLTGGIHNLFAMDDYLFALDGGDKYQILDVRDLYAPKFVSEYNHPDSRLHDVWVEDGFAYSSEWANGVVVVDVGNGRYGGSIENPVFVTNVPYPVGATHAAFPYHQESTGKTYLFLGDEIMNRQGAAWGGVGTSGIPQPGGTPGANRGYIHIIDFTDPMNPVDVARYEAREFGTHNLWVEDDILYVAYYEGGVRVVDISGELMGNLGDQGREIAVFKAFDPNGYVANAPMAWGPQPYKGNLFFTDFNSGLWAIRILPRGRIAS